MHGPEDLTLPGDLPPEQTASYRPPQQADSQLPTNVGEWQTLSVAAGTTPADAASPTRPTSTTGGPAFHLIEVVGRGGFGEVWLARQNSLGRSVAVKRLREDRYRAGEDVAELEAGFRFEALTTANLEHPNIVPVHDVGVDESGRPLIAMKFVRGTAWDALIAREFKSLAPADFLPRHLAILIDVSHAVAFAHSRGVVHRDLKPAQVVVGEYGEVMLMDWGLAVQVGGDAAIPNTSPATPIPSTDPAPAPRREAASSPSGTPAYMAPEQTEPTARNVGTWTDIYLLGGILYNLLTGRPPHLRGDASEAFRHAAAGIVDDPRTVAPQREIPAELATLSLKALAKSPKDRVAAVEDFIAALQDYLGGAGKRREAMVLLASARRLLETRDAEYSELAEALSAIERAGGLWPGNAEIEAVREEALEAYARRALALRDLNLAQQQAQRLPAREATTALLREIDHSRTMIRRHARQRRMAFAAVAGLVAVVLLGGAYYTNAVRQERDRAEEARGIAEKERAIASEARAVAEEQRGVADIARARSEQARAAEQVARLRAEGLMQFMVTDLSTSLNRTGQLPLLDTVIDEAFEYFSTMDESEATTTSISQRIYALSSLAKVQLQRGKHSEGFATINKAGQLTTTLMEEHLPKDQVPHLVLANVAMIRAEALTGLGDLAGANEALGKATDQAIAAVNTAGDDTATLRNTAKLLSALSTSWVIAGNLDRSGKVADAALRAVEMLRSKVEPTPEDSALEGGILRVLADVRLFQGGQAEALPKYEQAAGIFAAARELDPANYTLLVEYSTVLSRLGYVSQIMLSDEEKALDYNERGLDVSRALVELNPTSMAARRDYAVALALLAMTEDSLGRLEDAYRHASESTEATKLIATVDAANTVARIELSSRYSTQSIIALRLGWTEEAMKVLEEGVALARRMKDNGELATMLTNHGRIPSAVEFAELAKNHASQLYEAEQWRSTIESATLGIEILGMVGDHPQSAYGRNKVSRSCWYWRMIAEIALEDYDAASASSDGYERHLKLCAADELGRAENPETFDKDIALSQVVLHIIRGRIAKGRNDEEAARREFEAALVLSIPAATDGYADQSDAINSAECLVHLGRLEEARPWLAIGASLLDRQPKTREFFIKAGLLHEDGTLVAAP